MADDSLKLIRGWLLLYVVWACWGIAYAIFTNGIALVHFEKELPFMLSAGVASFVLVLLFYGLYAVLLFCLIRKQQGIVRKIKLMIALAPVFNTLLPAIFTAVLVMTNDKLAFMELIGHAYPPEILGSLVGAAAVAAVWYRYFTVSRRVAAIWPNG